MPLSLHNTLTRKKEVFAPIDSKNVRMYVCGPTVYDLAHIGNARPVIVFDVLYRLLRHIYGEQHVKYVRNITDVDDKINAAAKANGETIRDLTDRTAKVFHEDVAALGCLPPDVEPRATEHIAQMIAMIERLIASGYAYEAEQHVLFDVGKDQGYGKLSHRNRDEMIAGARVEVAPYKRDAADFVLWKPSSEDLPGWDSPWGRGRPGWHIECSAMSETHLGESFDIHGGGLDLIFPHHENEIAQSECVHGGKMFARYWLHNGFVTVDGAKMAKSEGNFRTIRDVLAEAGGVRFGEAARFAMLMGHYRDPLDWTSERLAQARQGLDRFYLALRGAAKPAAGTPMPAKVQAALDDDLNTPLAIAALYELMAELNKASDPAEKARLQSELIAGGVVMGLLQQDPEAWLQGDSDAVDDRSHRDRRAQCSAQGEGLRRSRPHPHRPRPQRHPLRRRAGRDDLAPRGLGELLLHSLEIEIVPRFDELLAVPASDRHARDIDRLARRCMRARDLAAHGDAVAINQRVLNIDLHIGKIATQLAPIILERGNAMHRVSHLVEKTMIVAIDGHQLRQSPPRVLDSRLRRTSDEAWFGRLPWHLPLGRVHRGYRGRRRSRNAAPVCLPSISSVAAKLF